MHYIIRLLALASLLSIAGAAHAQAVDLTGLYNQNFDSMGVSGTAPPTGWSLYTGNSGTSNATWTTSITANGTNSVASMVATSAALTAITTPTATNNNGYNAALSSSNTADRVLSTSPTSVSGAALQLAMTNDTGIAMTGMNLSYDTVRYGAASTVNELPGYELFYSLNGTSWANVASFNPTIITVPNSAGVSNFGGALVFSTAVAEGATFYLRWVDDNAQQTSPDQIIGLNNVAIAPVPEPETYALMLAGLGLLGFVARRRKQQAA